MKRLNLMVASALGTTLEWYDFFAFAACAVFVFDKKFFVAADPFVASLLALATFSIGFVARPVGGILFGHFGDKIGRKKTLVVSLLLMGFSTFSIGLLPTYQSVGLLAPALLVALRILQGIAVGGEATGAILIIAESMPRTQRGFWTSFTMFAGPLANVLTALVIGAIQGLYGFDAFVDWAWRLPFLISAVLVFLGFWTRRRVEESAAFAELARHAAPAQRLGLKHALRFNRPEMAKAFFVKASENTFLYLFSTFLLGFATHFLHLPQKLALGALMKASAVEVLVVMAAAGVSDRLGRRPVMLVGFAAAVAAGFTLFSLQPGAAVDTLQWALILCLGAHGVILGAMAAYMAELFPTAVRYSALSTSYQLASVLGGSIAPLIGTALLQYTGSAKAVATYAALVAVPALLCVLRSPETRGRDIVDEGTPPPPSPRQVEASRFHFTKECP